MVVGGPPIINSNREVCRPHYALGLDFGHLREGTLKIDIKFGVTQCHYQYLYLINAPEIHVCISIQIKTESGYGLNWKGWGCFLNLTHVVIIFVVQHSLAIIAGFIS